MLSGVCSLEQHLGGVANRGNRDSSRAFGVCVCDDADHTMEQMRLVKGGSAKLEDSETRVRLHQSSLHRATKKDALVDRPRSGNEAGGCLRVGMVASE